VEFGAIVEGERLELAAVVADGTRCRSRHLVGVTGSQLLDDRVPGLAFQQREHAMPQVAAHDRVAFPMSDVLAPFDFHRAVANRPLAGQDAPGIMAAVALAPEFAHDARVAPQVTARPFIPANAPVDGLVADVQRAALPEHAGDLLGTPFSAQQPRHLRHLRDAEVRTPATAPATGRSVAVRLLGPVHAVVTGYVAPQFPHDRAAVAPQQAGSVRRRISARPLRGDQVSFFLGELVIRRHGCNPVPGRMRRQLVSPLPTRFQDVLHLPCESARPNPALNRTGRHMTSTCRASARPAG